MATSWDSSPRVKITRAGQVFHSPTRTARAWASRAATQPSRKTDTICGRVRHQTRPVSSTRMRRSDQITRRSLIGGAGRRRADCLFVLLVTE